MFNPKAIAAGALRRAPQFLIARVPNVVDGVIGCYLTFLFFCSGLGWFHTMGAVIVVAAMAYGVEAFADRSIGHVVHAVEGTFNLMSVSSTIAPSTGIARPSPSSAASKQESGEKLD